MGRQGGSKYRWACIPRVHALIGGPTAQEAQQLPSAAGIYANGCSKSRADAIWRYAMEGQQHFWAHLRNHRPQVPRREVTAVDLSKQSARHVILTACPLTRRRARLPRRSGPLACDEASEVLLKLGQESIGHPSLLAVPREDGPCIPGQLEPWCVLKQLKYLWNLHKNQLATVWRSFPGGSQR